jgi:putative colanic acid biosysnthesis UDP-glucose lipid carrier transferase
MPHRYSFLLKPIHFLGDLLVLNFSFLGGYYLKFSSLEKVFASPYGELLLFFNIAWVALVIVFKNYSGERTIRIAEELRGLSRVVIIHLLLLCAFFAMNKAYFYSREQVLLSYLIFAGLIFIWRIAFIYLLRIYRSQGFNNRKVIIVGYGDLGEELRKFFRLHPEFGYKFLGYFDDEAKNKKVVGGFDRIKSYVVQNAVDEIYCCLPYINYGVVKELIDLGESHCLKVKLIADFRGVTSKELELQRYDHIPVLNVSNIPLDDLKNKAIKRFFDIGFSSLVIFFILSWLVPLIALAIKIDSRGPVFFKQKRTGKNNQSFWCLKFRTMVVNKESDSKQATKNDTRITAVGAFLRKTSLDELPQFFNVLAGDMSVVGPRPHMLKHTEEYSRVIEKFMSRHFVKPGITGLAQAKGFRGETHDLILMKNRVKMDRFYISNWSLFFDLKIIVMTVLGMVKGDKNAY